MSEITPGFIAKLRALLACIETPLPWKSKPAEYESKRYGAEVISGAFITPFTLEFGDEFMGLHDGDAALLTEAANALPALLDEVERMSGENKLLYQALVEANSDAANLAELLSDQVKETLQFTTAPENDFIDDICRTSGYGAVISTACKLWAKRDPVGSFTIGHCVGTIRADLRKHSDRLKKQDALKGGAK